MIGAIIGVAGLVILNIIIVAFGYGKLSQKVDDLPCIKGCDCPKNKANKGGKENG